MRRSPHLIRKSNAAASLAVSQKRFDEIEQLELQLEELEAASTDESEQTVRCLLLHQWLESNKNPVCLDAGRDRSALGEMPAVPEHQIPSDRRQDRTAYPIAQASQQISSLHKNDNAEIGFVAVAP